MKIRTHQAEELETDYLARVRHNLVGRNPNEASDLIQGVSEHIEEALLEYTEHQVSAETMSHILAKLGPADQYLSSANAPQLKAQTALTIRRSTGRFGFLRMLHIGINDNQIIQFGNSEEKVIALEPGEYTIVAKMDWGKSKPLRLRLLEGQNKLVIVEAIPYPLLLARLFLPPFHIFKLRGETTNDSTTKAKPINWIRFGTFWMGGLMLITNSIMLFIQADSGGHTVNWQRFLIDLPIFLLFGFFFGLFMQIWVKKVDKVKAQDTSR